MVFFSPDHNDYWLGTYKYLFVIIGPVWCGNYITVGTSVLGP